MPLEIKLAYDDIDSVRNLFGEYVAALGMDSGSSDHGDELAELPGDYAPPDGRLYIAAYNDRPAGCVALRRYDAGRCEMSRLYVRPEFRGLGVGRALVQRIVSDAKTMQCNSLILDTRRRLENSVALCKKFGFHEIEPYCQRSYPDALFLGLDLPA